MKQTIFLSVSSILIIKKKIIFIKPALKRVKILEHNHPEYNFKCKKSKNCVNVYKMALLDEIRKTYEVASSICCQLARNI